MDAFADPQYKTDDGAALRIWRDTAQNKFQSEKFGRAIFDEVIYCEVITPGSRDSTPVFELERVFPAEVGLPPKRSTKYEQFLRYVEDFKRAETDDTSLAGTPLSQWAEMPRSMVAALKVSSIFTVDALAVLPDTKLSVVGPDGRQWRDKAAAYIANARDTGYATKLAADLAVERQNSADLAAQVTALAGQVQALTQQLSATGAPVNIAPVGTQEAVAQNGGDVLPII